MGESPQIVQLDPHDGSNLFTEKIVETTIKQLKRGKSGDQLGLTIEIFKTLLDTELLPTLVNLFNKIVTNGCLPEAWRHSMAIPLFKASNPQGPENYCPNHHDQRHLTQDNGKMLRQHAKGRKVSRSGDNTSSLQERVQLACRPHLCPQGYHPVDESPTKSPSLLLRRSPEGFRYCTSGQVMEC